LDLSGVGIRQLDCNNHLLFNSKKPPCVITIIFCIYCNKPLRFDEARIRCQFWYHRRRVCMLHAWLRWIISFKIGMIDTILHIDRCKSNLSWFKSSLMRWTTLTDCKEGYVHSFAWFAIQNKRMCIHCLVEEWHEPD